MGGEESGQGRGGAGEGDGERAAVGRLVGRLEDGGARKREGDDAPSLSKPRNPPPGRGWERSHPASETICEIRTVALYTWASAHA